MSDTIEAVQLRDGGPWHRVRPEDTSLTFCGLRISPVKAMRWIDWRTVNDLHRCGRCGHRPKARRL